LEGNPAHKEEREEVVEETEIAEDDACREEIEVDDETTTRGDSQEPLLHYSSRLVWSQVPASGDASHP
jgi:hypothetical protein